MDLIRTKEVAAMLGLDAKTLERKRAEDPGFLRFYRLGPRVVRYDRADVLAKIMSCAVGGSEQDQVEVPQK